MSDLFTFEIPLFLALCTYTFKRVFSLNINVDDLLFVQ